jgi:hypothetical protein
MRFHAFAFLLFLGFAAVQPVQAAAEETAQTALANAETKAQQEGKNVLVTFSASWCGNCHLLDRMLADRKIGPILSSAFVRIDLITGERPDDRRHANTPGGIKFQSELGGARAGWPYFAMLDTSGKLLVDSFRPSKGRPHAKSIGYPATSEEIEWFGQMLEIAAPKLTSTERATVRDWLKKHSPV